MTLPETEPRYVISVAAKMVDIETHTLRYYERLGLVQPYRSRGNIRYYSENDIGRLRQIKTLMEDLGINLAGVGVVLRMAEKISEMQHQLQQLEAEISNLRKSGRKRNKLKEGST